MPNSNVSQNQNSVPVGDTNAETAKAVDRCTGTAQDKANYINGYLDGKIDDPQGNPLLDGLKRERDKGVFAYKAVATATPVDPPTNPPSTTETVYLYIGGGIGDDRTNASPKDIFQPFLALLKPFHKRTCINKIVFVPVAQVPQVVSATALDPIEGFEWFGCENGTFACPGGRCSNDPTCPIIVKRASSNEAPTPTSNTNTNSHSNTNTYSNSTKPGP